MNNGIIKEANGIYRLKIPFEETYTSVFVLEIENGVLLVDCATTDFDVDNYIVPFLLKLGKSIEFVTYLVLSHEHIDHAGGLKRLLQLNGLIKVIDSVEKLPSGLEIYKMAGHLNSCIGVFDAKTKILISCDGLQGAGVSKYKCSIGDKQGYIDTIERIKKDKRIEKILFSHPYEPWCKNFVEGKEEIDKCLSDCLKYIGE